MLDILPSRPFRVDAELDMPGRSTQIAGIPILPGFLVRLQSFRIGWLNFGQTLVTEDGICRVHGTGSKPPRRPLRLRG
jgi:hypothetical protein